VRVGGPARVLASVNGRPVRYRYQVIPPLCMHIVPSAFPMAGRSSSSSRHWLDDLYVRDAQPRVLVIRSRIALRAALSRSAVPPLRDPAHARSLCAGLCRQPHLQFNWLDVHFQRCPLAGRSPCAVCSRMRCARLPPTDTTSRRTVCLYFASFPPPRFDRFLVHVMPRIY